MKPILAFVGGAVLAGGIAYIALRPSSSPELQVTKVEEAPIAAQSAPVVAESSIPKETERAVAPVSTARAPRVVPKKLVAAPAMARVEEPVRQEAPAPTPTPTPTPTPIPAPVARVEETPAPPPPPKPVEPNRVTIAAGTKVTVRLAQSISTETAQVGDPIQATLDQPIVVDGFILAERGARIEGKVTESTPAGKVKGTSRLELELTRLATSDGQRIGITTVAWAKEGEETKKADAAKVAAGAGIGAALGAIFGGGKGAAVGAGAGGAAGGGVVLATRGKPVVVPTETRITFQLKAPVTVVEKR